MPRKVTGVDFRFIGDRELRRDLTRMAANVQKKLARKALRLSAKAIADGMKAAAPRDRGDLKASVRVRAMKRSRTRIGVLAMAGEKGTGRRGDAPWAFHVEYGTEHTPAQPFVRPTAAREEKPTLQRFSQGMRELVNEHIGRGRR